MDQVVEIGQIFCETKYLIARFRRVGPIFTTWWRRRVMDSRPEIFPKIVLQAYPNWQMIESI